MARPNEHIFECASIIRRAGKNWNEEALEQLKDMLETQWGENVIAANPEYTSMIRMLQKDVITREERVKLISDIENS